METYELLSEIAGTVIEIDVAAGESVSSGTPLLTIEAMKMHIPYEAPSSGTVAEVCVTEGDKVVVGQVLARITS